MQAKRGRPKKVIEPIVPVPVVPPEPPKQRRRLQTFEGDKLEKIVELADEVGYRWPKTCEALFAAGWILAKEMYDECAPKIEGMS